jgi:hypothetical protein
MQDVHISTEESRIMRKAEMLIADEMQSLLHELELLRADTRRSYELQRSDLQEFYKYMSTVIKRIEQ